MTLPSYVHFIDPLLRFLVAHPEGVRAQDAHEAMAVALGLDDEDRQLSVPTGQPLYCNRTGWAHDRLKRAGYSTSPRRGWWQVTPAGRACAETHPGGLTADEARRLAKANLDIRLRPASEEGADAMAASDGGADEVMHSPDDRLQAALEEIRAAVSAELLELLGSSSPKFFETVVLDVLHKLGYGTSRGDLKRVGGPGDAGIDGVISLDRLGLEKVYVQAKRWQGTVGRPEVQAFYGALAGQRARKGVFITTSSFTAQAVEFARSVEQIVLVDGARLTELMMDCGVGVSVRAVGVPKIDSDYFGG